MISDIDAFRAAWQASRSVEADHAPTAKWLVALDLLAEGVVARVAHGSTVEAALKPFQAAVGKPEFVGDESDLDALVFRDGERRLVEVRIGAASSLAVFDAKGRRLAVPPAYRWGFPYFGPIRRVGALLMVDAQSVQAAGMRYAFRLGFLRRTARGYVVAGRAEGEWTLGESDETWLVEKGGRITFDRLDDPRTFFVSNAERAIRRRETWDANGLSAHRVGTRLLDPDLRAVDNWLWAHRGAKLGKAVLPRERSMANEIRRTKGHVTMDLDGFSDGKLRFDLVLVGSKNVVRRVSVVP